MSRLGDRIAPRSLGDSFRWLWAATVAGNLGDGLLLAVRPLLLASITSDPFAVALAVFMQRLPWLLFGLLAGAVVDRVDRRLLSAAVDAARAVVVGGLTITIATGTVTASIVYAAMFLLGTAETLADNAATALVADTVPTEGLGIANSRLIGSIMVTNQLAGPPIGAALFGIGTGPPVRDLCRLHGRRRRAHHPHPSPTVRITPPGTSAPCDTRSPKASSGCGGTRRSAPWP